MTARRAYRPVMASELKAMLDMAAHGHSLTTIADAFDRSRSHIRRLCGDAIPRQAETSAQRCRRVLEAYEATPRGERATLHVRLGLKSNNHLRVYVARARRLRKEQGEAPARAGETPAARLRRILAAYDAAGRSERDTLHERFGLKTNGALRVAVARARRMVVAERARP